MSLPITEAVCLCVRRIVLEISGHIRDHQLFRSAPTKAFVRPCLCECSLCQLSEDTAPRGIDVALARKAYVQISLQASRHDNETAARRSAKVGVQRCFTRLAPSANTSRGSFPGESEKGKYRCVVISARVKDLQGGLNKSEVLHYGAQHGYSAHSARKTLNFENFNGFIASANYIMYPVSRREEPFSVDDKKKRSDVARQTPPF